MKKIIMNIIVVIMLSASVSFLISCCMEKIFREPTEGDVVNSQVYIDKDTGVNYILFSSNGKCGVCPRYKADGTMYISGVE